MQGTKNPRPKLGGGVGFGANGQAKWKPRRPDHLMPERSGTLGHRRLCLTHSMHALTCVASSEVGRFLRCGTPAPDEKRPVPRRPTTRSRSGKLGAARMCRPAAADILFWITQTGRPNPDRPVFVAAAIHRIIGTGHRNRLSALEEIEKPATHRSPEGAMGFAISTIRCRNIGIPACVGYLDPPKNNLSVAYLMIETFLSNVRKLS